MAKVALIERELKREKLVAKYAAKHAELKAIANDAKKSDEERAAARLGLQGAAVSGGEGCVCGSNERQQRRDHCVRAFDLPTRRRLVLEDGLTGQRCHSDHRIVGRSRKDAGLGSVHQVSFAHVDRRQKL